MTLTTTQRSTLKADVLANADTNALWASGNLGGLLDLYNALAAPAFIVWRSDIVVAEIKDVVIWTEYFARSVAEQNAFAFLLLGGIVDAGRPNIRAGFNDIFTGTQTFTALVELAKRSSTRLEKLFATGAGTVASPATLVVEGTLLVSDLIGL